MVTGAEVELISNLASLTAQAKENKKLASSLYVKEHGISSIFRLRFWSLQLLRLSISFAKPIIIVVIVALIVLGAVLFGAISTVYGVYFLKTIGVVIINVFLTIANAFWFGWNGLSLMVYGGFSYIINNMMYYFLSPLVDSLNFVIHMIPGLADFNLVIPAIGPDTLSLQPSHAFSYMAPKPVAWGDWGSVLSIDWVHVGTTPFLTGEYTTVASQNGAELLFPEIQIDSVAEGWWSEIVNRPEDIDFTRRLTVQYISPLANLGEMLMNLFTNAAVRAAATVAQVGNETGAGDPALWLAGPGIWWTLGPWNTVMGWFL